MRYVLIRSSILMAILVLAASGPIPARAADEVLATIGTKQITTADLQKKIEEVPEYARESFLTKEGKMKLLDRLIRTELLLRAATDAGYDKKPEIQSKLEDARVRILTSEFYKTEMGGAPEVDEKQRRAYYDAHKKDYETDATASVKHIQLETEKEARDVRQQITSGSITFDAAAEKFSKDAESAKSGGNLGTVTKGGPIKGIGKSPEFEKTIFGLKQGEVSEPVNSRKGWHLLQVTSITEAGFRPFEDVREQIAEDMLISDSEIEKEYKANQNEYKNRARLKIRHIMLDTEADAKAVREELLKGADFNKLVETRSKDESTIKQHGNLGYVYKDGQIRVIGNDPIFRDALFKLKEGEYSDPIKSAKGWHVVMVDEKTEETVKPMTEVRALIKSKLVRDKKESGMEQKFEDLKKKYGCTIFEDKLGDSSPGNDPQKK